MQAVPQEPLTFCGGWGGVDRCGGKGEQEEEARGRPHRQTILMMACFGEGGGISLDLQLI